MGCNGLSLFIEDDGDVCYAYLANGKGILAHVWMYNRTEAPIKYPWITGSAAIGEAHKNPKEFVSEKNISLPDNEDDFRIESSIDVSAKEGEVKIFIKKTHFATLNLGETIGYSLLAAKPSPLANPLV